MANLGRNIRNAAIVLALAAIVAFAPNGGNAAEVVLTLITMAFLTAIAWTVYVLSRENQLTLAALSDGRRAILYGAFGLLALLVAGTDELFSSGAGSVAWILLFAGAVAAIYLVWKEATTYS
jgi:hypothetical protein